jgi:RimJ/RimL family protein N-acetyltransferase
MRLVKAAGGASLQSAAPLFANWQETLIWSALEGGMGSIWTLEGSPRAALCENGDFLFLAGDAGDEQTAQLLQAWKREHEGRPMILAPQDPACAPLIAAVFGGAAVKNRRWAFRKDADAFDLPQLTAFAQSLPRGVVLRPLDEELCRRSMAQEWSRDWCSQFGGTEDFLSRGMGVAALYGNEIIGGASSYTVWSGGVEIQIDTRQDWRGQGVATACGAALMLRCFEKGLRPSWDAANDVSRRLACRLGFVEAGPYEVWELY